MFFTWCFIFIHFFPLSPYFLVFIHSKCWFQSQDTGRSISHSAAVRQGEVSFQAQFYPTHSSLVYQQTKKEQEKRRFKWDLSLKSRQKKYFCYFHSFPAFRGKQNILEESWRKDKSCCFKWQIQNTSVRKGWDKELIIWVHVLKNHRSNLSGAINGSIFIIKTEGYGQERLSSRGRNLSIPMFWIRGIGGGVRTSNVTPEGGKPEETPVKPMWVCIVHVWEIFRPERSPWETKQAHEWGSLCPSQLCNPTGIGNSPGRRAVPPSLCPLCSLDTRVNGKKL